MVAKRPVYFHSFCEDIISVWQEGTVIVVYSDTPNK